MKNTILNIIRKVWSETETKSVDFQNNTIQPSKKIIFILLYVPLALSLVKYLGNISYLLECLQFALPQQTFINLNTFFFNNSNADFYRIMYWVAILIFCYLLIPLIVIIYFFNEQPSNYGFSLKNAAKGWKIYFAMSLFMIPIVLLAASTDSFLSKYPLFQPPKNNLFPYFLIWHFAYLIQFVAVEFFFRGFILHGIKARFGFYAVFISTIPYCMIHFGKPFGETIAAIAAGIILGTLSLYSRTIILGILLHYIVALSMDLLALWREGYF
jgi:uncharacterized protein